MAEEKFNQDELVPPSFITEAYIVDVIQKVEDDPELHVINYEIKPGSSAGDHYASVMFKLIATYGTRGKIITDRRFIIKTIPEVEGPKKELLENMPAFKNEIIMYTKTLPAMEELLKEHGEKPWWPKLVYSQQKPFVLMFDDLTVEQYQVVYDPLDFETLKMIIDKIGKYHALSVVLLQNGHTQVTQFEAGITSAMMDMFMPMATHLQNISKILQTWEGFEKIGEKLFKIAPKLAVNFFNGDKTQNDRFFVLCHGDFHIRNLMFKKSKEGELSDAIFLDFQMPVYFSPAMDLIGLLNTMGNAGVRLRSDEVIKRYHEQLTLSLNLFGYSGKVPSVIDIQIEMLKISPYHVFSSLLAIPMFTIKGVELSELFNVSEDSAAVIGIKKAYYDPEIIADLKPLIRSFYYRGVFDE